MWEGFDTAEGDSKNTLVEEIVKYGCQNGEAEEDHLHDGLSKTQKSTRPDGELMPDV